MVVMASRMGFGRASGHTATGNAESFGSVGPFPGGYVLERVVFGFGGFGLGVLRVGFSISASPERSLANFNAGSGLIDVTGSQLGTQQMVPFEVLGQGSMTVVNLHFWRRLDSGSQYLVVGVRSFIGSSARVWYSVTVGRLDHRESVFNAGPQ